MSKISFIAPIDSLKSGMANVLFDVSKNLSQNEDIEVVIFKKLDNDENLQHYQTNNLKIIYNDTNSFLKKLIFLASFFTRTNTKKIVCLSDRNIKLAYWCKKLFFKKYKIISWMHLTIDNEKFINKKNLNYADFHLAISSGIQNQLLDMGIPKNKIFLIYNPAKRKKLLQENFVLDKKVKKLLYIGRIEQKQKNIKLLLDALDGFEFDWQLDIYGDGPDFQNMQDYAKQNVKNNQNIIWHGWHNDPWNEIKEIDLLLMTSNYEGFGMVLVEAISRGIPCISSNCPVGPSDIIQNHINGLLFKVGDKQNFIDKTNQFFKEQQNYLPQKIAGSIEQFYEDNYFAHLEQILTGLTEKEK